MSVIARDTVAADHLVYAWPFPIGPDEYEVACAEDEQVVMCPSWVVGGLFGPGRHRYRSPNPMQPTAAYFVLNAPVEVSFDFATTFALPISGEAVRVRSAGSLQVRCSDPSLLIAQFVGLPFDAVNDDILRSVSRSVERMLARLLTRRVVMAATANAVTDPQMLGSILEELVAYNPAAGAVFGVELVRMGHVSIGADDGTKPLDEMFANPDWSGPRQRQAGGTIDTERGQPADSAAETIRAPRGPSQPTIQPMAAVPAVRAESQPRAGSQSEASGEISAKPPRANSDSTPPVAPPRANSPSRPPPTPPAGVARSKTPSLGVVATKPPPTNGSKTVTPPSAAPTPRMMPATLPPIPEARRARTVEVPQSTDDTTQPHHTPAPGTLRLGAATPIPPEPKPEPRGSILGIGMAHIGSSEVASGEIPQKVSPGARVLVPGPDGLMQSATVRQLLQGYYELEVGGTGETIWVPVTNVVPEQ
ncbi:MAG TPA: hypothetical protein VH143_09300 [Kofleriaceae bacterium]|jgi:hypothetical protein|nr:hypothetical protein [Kofleriaceae bacterium]